MWVLVEVLAGLLFLDYVDSVERHIVNVTLGEWLFHSPRLQSQFISVGNHQTPRSELAMQTKFSENSGDLSGGSGYRLHKSD